LRGGADGAAAIRPRVSSTEQFLNGDRDAGNKWRGDALPTSVCANPGGRLCECPDLNQLPQPIDDPILLRAGAGIERAFLDIVDLDASLRDHFHDDVRGSRQGTTARKMESIGQHDGDVRSNVVFGLLTPDDTRFDQ
jgi:hypothetical protein